jgi:murein DD-endopeptidase MepM/ murein hydrolase activator NlpD
MLELIPTLLAQQSKQVSTPVQPIETPAQAQAKAATSAPVEVTPAVAAPEPIIVPAALVTSPKQLEIPQLDPSNSGSVQAGSPAPQVATSPIALPPVPLKRQLAPQPANSQLQATSTDVKKTTTTKPVEKPSLNAPSLLPRPSQQNSALSSTSAQPKVNASTESAIDIPVPKAFPQSTASNLQRQLLEQRLAEIVAKDRAAKQAQQAQVQNQQRDTLVSRAYDYATQRQYAQARKLLQNPTISAEVRSQILNNINALEAASRAVSLPPLKTPTVAKPSLPARTVTAQKPPAIFRGVPSITGRSEQTITIQVPRAINSLPVQRQAIASKIPAQLIASSSSGSSYIDQIGSSMDQTSSSVDQVSNAKDLQAFNRNLPKPTSGDQIVYPLPEPVSVTSRFGWRRHPVTGVRRFHAGVDLGAGQGTPIIASRSGRVTAADRMGGYGLAVVMEQPDGSHDTLYAHMSQILVRPGQRIQAGTVIGRVGSTGLSTGPHLHYEARQKTNSGWTPVDPGGQLEAARVRLVRARQLNAQVPAPNLQSTLPDSNRGV